MMGLLPLQEETRALPLPLPLPLPLSLPLLLSHSPPHEDTARRQPSASQEESPYQELDLASTLILDFQTVELQEINVCCLSHPVCDSSKAH